MGADAEAQQSFSFLDTSVLLTLLGCPTSMDNIRRAVQGHALVLHQVHYDEAVRRLKGAVFQLLNTGQDGDPCLTRLAQQVLQRLKRRRLELRITRAKSLKELGRLKILVRQEAQRLLRSLIVDNNVAIVDDDAKPERSIECPDLSYEDQLLVELAIECHTIVSNDNGVIRCCLKNTRISSKCVKP